MLILIGMIFLIFYLLEKNIKDTKLRKIIICIFIFALVFQGILLTIYRLELNNLGLETYYSDATDYWNATKAIIDGNETKQFNSLYYISCAIIQKSSPFIWAGFNNIFNILCVDLTITLALLVIYKILDKAQDKNKNKQTILFSILNLFNPFIIYALMRNLKDAEFLLIIMIMAYVLYWAIENKSIKNTIIFFSILSVLSILLLYIRPWGIFICLIPILIFAFTNKEILKNKKIWLILLVFFIGIIILFYKEIAEKITIWIPIILKSAFSRGITQNLLGIPKLILGPGPIRAVFGSKYFMYYTISRKYYDSNWLNNMVV